MVNQKTRPIGYKASLFGVCLIGLLCVAISISTSKPDRVPRFPMSNGEPQPIVTDTNRLNLNTDGVQSVEKTEPDQSTIHLCEENGRPVYKIRVKESGDEVTICAVTGKVLSVQKAASRALAMLRTRNLKSSVVR